MWITLDKKGLRGKGISSFKDNVLDSNVSEDKNIK